MLTLLAMYGPDSWFGWLVLLIVASLPVLVLSAGDFIVPADPEATASFLRDRAVDKRQQSRHGRGPGQS